MFNQKDDGNIITYKPATEIIFDGLQAVINIPNNYISSFGNEDLEELDKEFGIAAQNTALEQVRALNSNDWLESIKIDKSKLKENKKTSEDKTENIKIEDEYTR